MGFNVDHRDFYCSSSLENDSKYCVTCGIINITTANMSGCMDNGTVPDYFDDYFEVDVIVEFEMPPTGGQITITGNLLDQPLTESITNDTLHRFENVVMRTDITNGGAQVSINITAYFTNPVCGDTLTINNVQYFSGLDTLGNPIYVTRRAPKPCSVCVGPPGTINGGVPNCWPDEVVGDPCATTINYAPTPGIPESVPIRYIKTVLHIFQKEYPHKDSLGLYIPHPTDLGNYSTEHLDLLKSWFDDPEGVNGQLANLCDDPTDSSPYMTDSRIRLINSGTEGVDIFFHPDNQAWGMGYAGCDFNGTPYPSSTIENRYLGNNIDTLNPYFSVLSTPEVQNSFHVFITGGKWVDSNDSIAGMIGVPDTTDCYWPCAGGFTGDLNGCGLGTPAAIQWIMGSYNVFLSQGDLNLPCGKNYPGSDIALGGQMTGELFHVLSVDHISPLQAHVDLPFEDGCEDTPWETPYNYMGCSDTLKCALTECQLGRIHHLFADAHPLFERFPTCEGGYSLTPENCCIIGDDIVIPDGADVVWGGARQLLSNIIVESGGKLTITCDIGMPENGRITVETGGQLFVDGARIYNNCDGTYWDGIVVEGHVNYGDSPELQGFCQLSVATIENAHIGVRCQDQGVIFGNNTYGGIVQAVGTTFRNCQKHAVEIRNYGNVPMPSGHPTGDANDFIFCQFIVDDEYQGNISAFQSMVSLKSVRGISFVACNFSNTYPTTNIQARKDGIYGQNAGFSLGGFSFFTSTISSTVSGFSRGIYANSFLNTAIRVSNSRFGDNWIGIYANAAHNAVLISNTFQVGSYLPLDSALFSNGADRAYIGIDLVRSRGYKVENNAFELHEGQATENPVGILTNASGPYYNEIYRNRFKDMYVANLANGGNRSNDPNIGLQYLCNQSLGGNEFDFSVKSITKVSSSGIGKNQGSSQRAAGNTFTFPPPDTLTHFNNGEQEIEYFFFDASAQEPTDFTDSTVTKTQVFISNLCTSKLPTNFDGGITEDEKEQHQSDFNSSSDIGEKANAANTLIHHFLTDSIDYNLDSARYWLAQKGGLEDHFQIVNTYIGEWDPTGAQAALDSIPNIFSLADDELVEYQYFDSLKTLQINAMLNEITEEKMVENNEDAIAKIADEQDIVIAGEARALLNNVLGEMYPPEIYFPGSGGQQLLVKPPNANMAGSWTTGQQHYLKAVPNPAKSQTVFHYQLPGQEESGKISIISVDGKNMGELTLRSNRGKAGWTTDGMPWGVYMYYLWVNGKKVATGRLVILK